MALELYAREVEYLDIVNQGPIRTSAECFEKGHEPPSKRVGSDDRSATIYPPRTSSSVSLFVFLISACVDEAPFL
jgi:hypothetical protein